MEKLTKEDIIKTLTEIKRDAERMHTGNVAHQRTHIMGTAQWLIDEISEGNTVLDPESKCNKYIVSNNEANNICPKCHKPKRMQNNTLQLLCECDSEVAVCPECDSKDWRFTHKTKTYECMHCYHYWQTDC